MARYQTEICSPVTYEKTIKVVQLFCVKHGNFSEKDRELFTTGDFASDMSIFSRSSAASKSIKDTNDFPQRSVQSKNLRGKVFVIKESENNWSGFAYGSKAGLIATSFHNPATVTIDVRENGLIIIGCRVLGFGAYCASVGNAIKTGLSLALDQLKIKQQEACSQKSAADEIREFKKLLDDGIITKAEFETKKAKLLGE